MTPSHITPEAFHALLDEGMPSGAALDFDVVTLERGHAVLRLRTREVDVRPGGSIAGPVLFGLADLAMYAVVLSVVGRVPMAVTTDATIHFLRRPTPGVLVATARLLKEGQKLMVGDVVIAPEGRPGDAVAHAVLTYAVPPSKAPAL